MLAAWMEFGAARFVGQRHQEKATELGLTRHDDALHRLEVLLGLLVVPVGRARRQFLQPKRRALRMACIAARMVTAPGEEDRLNLRPECLEVEPLGARRRRRGSLS